MPLVYNNISSPTPSEADDVGPPGQPSLNMEPGDFGLPPPPPTDFSHQDRTQAQISEFTNVAGVSNRAELIERIKAGETPTWIPNRSLAQYYPHHAASGPNLFDEHPDRPNSALHQGIFTNESRNSHNLPPSPTAFGPHPSLFAFHPSLKFPDGPTNLSSGNTSSELFQARTKARAPSFSNYVLKAATSPLVHSSNPDVDSCDSSSSSGSTEPIDISTRPFRSHSVRTSIPQSPLSSLQLSPTIPTFARNHTTGSAALGRRPTADGWWDGPASPSFASRQARRLSAFGNSSSDLPFGSFVGSYEESILNGRMSTTPSKPLNFVAQIGVLGLGKCKPSLRCPTHVTLPFPAYFYSVGDYDSPSPYVGQIDLDSALGGEKLKASKKPAGVGGSYRIPQHGQLQIVIKNPNKTAVKLFLVPYDLRDMEPGTKTMIRQKIYSTGNALLSDIGASIGIKKEKEKDALRYLIHLHICCPSRGRYYLHKAIRVVFANRVPDGKEKLKNEITWPEPKYTPWKPEGASAPTLANMLGNRKRSMSLFGASAMDARTDTPPPPLFMPPPMVEGKMEVDFPSTSEAGKLGEYQKMDVLGSNARGEGLLARRLKSLEVERVLNWKEMMEEEEQI
ncbi:hypothetical protein RUND412_011100 [Rhizina undulata]